MNQQDSQPTSANDEIIEQIHGLQEEIYDRENRISSLVDSFQEHPEVQAAIERHKSNRQVRLVANLKKDWETLLCHGRAVTDDDLEITAALVHFLGDLLAVQPDGVSERWIERLEDHLARHQAQVS